MAAAKKRSRRVARFFHADELAINSDVELDKSGSHHLLNVLRARAGDIIYLFNGDGFDYKATLLENNQRGANRQARLAIDERISRLSESPLSIRLLQCVSRSDRMEITIRQAVESGVAHIQPVLSRHSSNLADEKRLGKKQAHWQNIVTSASEQSGRTILAKLSEAQTLEHCLQANNNDDCKLVLSPSATVSIGHHTAQCKDKNSSMESISLLIGPESGLDNDEIAMSESHGFQAVHIGPRILRTETAGPACIVLLQTLYGDLQAK